MVSHLAFRCWAGPRLPLALPLQLLLQVGNAGEQCVGLGCPPLIHLLHTLLPGLHTLTHQQDGQASVFKYESHGCPNACLHVVIYGMGSQDYFPYTMSM